MSVWRGPSGIAVEVILLDGYPKLRVTRTVQGRRYWVAYCLNTDELAEIVDLADLVEVIPLPVR